MEKSGLGTVLSRGEFAFGFEVKYDHGFAPRTHLENQVRWHRRKRKLQGDPGALLLFRERQRLNYRRWYEGIKGTERYESIIERHRENRRKRSERLTAERTGVRIGDHEN
jgi:hypothetical protein